MNLLDLIKGGESEHLEFKKSTASLKQIGETLCAFLNSGVEGHVVVGVTGSKEIVGQEVSDHTLQQIAQLLKHFEPESDVNLQRIPLENGKEVLVLTAPSSFGKLPFLFKGRAYQRIGTTNSTMSRERFRHLLIDPGTTSRWERMPAEGALFEELDLDRIHRVIYQGIKLKRIPPSAADDIRDALEKLELIENGQLNNASQLLFGKSTGDLKLARFRGIDKRDFLDHKQVSGHAFDLLDEAEQFLARHIPIRGRFIPYRMARLDEPLIPFDALREALVNAICHRDYVYPGGAIDVAIYDDRVEIWSTGALPAGIRPDELLKPHCSIPRNPVISRVFYCAGLIERWGRGTNTIADLCTEAKLKTPRFVASHAHVGVVINAPVGVTRIEEAPLEEHLSDRKREILRLLKVNRRMSLAEIRAHFDAIPRRTLQDDLKQLKQLRQVDSLGRGRAAYWHLADVQNSTE